MAYETLFGQTIHRRQQFEGRRDIGFSVVRYGNVMGSRGSVIPFYLNRRTTGTLPITDPKNDSVQHLVGRRCRDGDVYIKKQPRWRDFGSQNPLLSHHRLS